MIDTSVLTGGSVTVQELLPYGIGLLVFVVTASAWRALLDRDPRAARSRMIAERRSELRGRLDRKGPARSRGREPLLRHLGRRFRLLHSARSDAIRAQLLRAGLRSRDTVPVYVAAKIILPMLTIAIVFLFTRDSGPFQLSVPIRSCALIASAIFGFFVPDIYIRNRMEKRRQSLLKGLPDGLDLMVICAEAGLSLDASLNRVAQEIGPSAPELADELALTAVELSFLPERRQALVNLENRSSLPAIRGVVNTLIQTEKYGTPLSQSLRVLSNEFRDTRMLRAEEKAARLPATLTVPMILFILPTLFIVLVGPAMLDVYDNLIK
jgi:tight adherence protein C